MAKRKKKEVVEQPSPEATVVVEEKESHTAKVDKTRAMSEPETDMRFAFNHVNHEAEIKFGKEPSTAVKELLTSRGFEYGVDQTTGEKVWHTPINYETRVQDRLHSKRTFWEAVDLTRVEMNLPKRSNYLE